MENIECLMCRWINGIDEYRWMDEWEEEWRDGLVDG